MFFDWHALVHTVSCLDSSPQRRYPPKFHWIASRPISARITGPHPTRYHLSFALHRLAEEHALHAPINHGAQCFQGEDGWLYYRYSCNRIIPTAGKRHLNSIGILY